MTNRAEELITQLEAEIVKRDARIAGLEATKLHGEMVMLRTDRDRLAAELKYTIAAYVTGNKPSGVADERAEFELAWPSIAAELPSRLRIRYSAGDVHAAEKEAALESWKHARLNPCRAQAVPDGYVLVPVEPTEAMRDAGNVWTLNRSTLMRAWDAMLAAAPSAKKEYE